MICDLAQTYHIFDYRQVPGRLLGTLVAGLGPNSRIYQKESGQLVPTEMFLQAAILDELRLIVYLLDGNKHKKQPKPITERLLETQREQRKEMVFASPEEFVKARQKIIGEVTKWQQN